MTDIEFVVALEGNNMADTEDYNTMIAKEFDAKIAVATKLLRENEAALDVAKRGNDGYKIVNLRPLIDRDRSLLRSLEQDRAAARPAGADNRRGSSAIFYGSNY
jgi:hypothetical protein